MTALNNATNMTPRPIEVTNLVDDQQKGGRTFFSSPFFAFRHRFPSNQKNTFQSLVGLKQKR